MRRRFIVLGLAAVVGVGAPILAFANSDDAARAHAPPRRSASLDEAATPQFLTDANLTEGFEDITDLPGWVLLNASEPLGITNWFQGNAAVFAAQAGEPTHYLGANFNNTSGSGTISNWLMLPATTIKTGDSIAFWTRKVAGSINPDRLELRFSLAGESTDVGLDALDVGVFEHVLLSINPDLEVGGYDVVWTRYVAEVSDVPVPTLGRFALRYFVTSGGPNGGNSDYIGVDTLSYRSAATLDVVDAGLPAVTLTPGAADEVVAGLSLAANDQRATRISGLTLAFGPVAATNTTAALVWSDIMDPASFRMVLGGDAGDVVVPTVTIVGNEVSLALPSEVEMPIGSSLDVLVTGNVRQSVARSLSPSVAGALAALGLVLVARRGRSSRRHAVVALVALAALVAFIAACGRAPLPPVDVAFTGQVTAVSSDASLVLGVPTPVRTYSVTFE
jgi:hypothetical protein